MLILKIYIEDEILKKYYENIIKVHNEKITNNKYADSGFDLYCPEDGIAISNETYKLDLKIICAMFDENNNPKPYYLYTRSSVSKTSLRLANNVGIIDSSYRGHIIAMFDNIKNQNYCITQYSRLVQICSSTLEPINVLLVNKPEELEITERGKNCFGSTGI